MMLCINTKQFRNEVLNFFVRLINYGLIHQNKAISEQSSKFLCNTVELWSGASKQSNFGTEF